MGGKKHKKKTFTTPKKNHHEKKKEPLAILKLYKIDDDSGKLEKLRKECPSPQCGAGSFMAAHFDRLSCGNCGFTYVFDTESDTRPVLAQASDELIIH